MYHEVRLKEIVILDRIRNNVEMFSEDDDRCAYEFIKQVAFILLFFEIMIVNFELCAVITLSIHLITLILLCIRFFDSKSLV